MAPNTKPKKKRRHSGRVYWRLVRRSLVARQTPQVRAMSIALGVFMAFTPLYGLQSYIGLALAFLFRLNKVLVLVLINVVTPYPAVPFIMYASFKIGGWLVNNDLPLPAGAELSGSLLADNLLQYMAGGFLLAVAMGALAASIFYPVFLFSEHRRKNQLAV